MKILETMLRIAVSSIKQKHDLTRQIQSIIYSNKTIRIYKDIASGLNFKRKEFRKLTDDICKGKVKQLIVTDRDRLLRFGLGLFKHMCDLHNCEIVVLHDSEDEDISLQNDLLSIINVFVAQHNGRMVTIQTWSRGELAQLSKWLESLITFKGAEKKASDVFIDDVLYQQMCMGRLEIVHQDHPVCFSILISDVQKWRMARSVSHKSHRRFIRRINFIYSRIS